MEKKEFFMLRFGLIYELKSNDSRRKTLTEFDINLFQFDKDDRIVDLKMFTNEEGMILILSVLPFYF